ncbi:hypothetical protein [Actinomadura rubrisoli]|uniref:Uncharacterized protein n=1 Tax=Actinomadura rubrisoli TaxID=2530368 RepID=A0A4R5CE32_9ACTN|nr:hypothetical protein [Actinomadura rubrisoli]TDD97229.1 hypothetical protein E1298_01980 [Actinomadura rubrisoli]
MEIAKELNVHEKYLIARLSEWGRTKEYFNHTGFIPSPLPEELRDSTIAKRLRAISIFVQGGEPEAELLQRSFAWIDELFADELDLIIDHEGAAAEWKTVPAEKNDWFIGRVYAAARKTLEEEF